MESGSTPLTLEVNGLDHGPTILHAPSVRDALITIDSLDGHAWSHLSITNDDTEGLFAVGGPTRFVCWLQHWTADRANLILENARDPSPPSGVLSVWHSNGLHDEFDVAMTISREQLVAVTRAYLSARHRAQDVRWERLGPA